MRVSPAVRETLMAVWHAVVVAIIATVGALIAPLGARDLDALGYGLILAGSFSLLALAWSPVVVLFATTAVAGVYGQLGYPGVAAAIPIIVALYKSVRAGHRWTPIVPGVGLGLGTVGALTSGEPVRDVLEHTFLMLGWLVAAVAIAEAAREWRQNLAQAESRATAAERTREEMARRRVAEERVRIARDLHDSLTHAISVIRVQVGVAVHLARKRGEDVPQALLAIQEASGDAVRELRATLDVLRDDDHRPGLDLLDDLVDRVRGAGIQVRLTVGGQRRDLPDEVDLTAYRIVQESLTNVARHAGTAAAHVRITYLADSLTVQVDDDGAADPKRPIKPGTGLTGMAERVENLGGQLRAMPRPEGGFTVRADLPTLAPASSPHPQSQVSR